jgi:hypothetical protein
LGRPTQHNISLYFLHTGKSSNDSQKMRCWKVIFTLMMYRRRILYVLCSFSGCGTKGGV